MGFFKEFSEKENIKKVNEMYAHYLPEDPYLRIIYISPDPDEVTKPVSFWERLYKTVF